MSASEPRLRWNAFQRARTDMLLALADALRDTALSSDEAAANIEATGNAMRGLLDLREVSR